MQVVAAVAGKRIKVYGYNMSNTTPSNFGVYSNATLISALGIAVVGGSEESESPLFQTAVGEALKINFVTAQAGASFQARYEVE